MTRSEGPVVTAGTRETAARRTRGAAAQENLCRPAAVIEGWVSGRAYPWGLSEWLSKFSTIWLLLQSPHLERYNPGLPISCCFPKLLTNSVSSGPWHMLLPRPQEFFPSECTSILDVSFSGRPPPHTHFSAPPSQSTPSSGRCLVACLSPLLSCELCEDRQNPCR